MKIVRNITLIFLFASFGCVQKDQKLSTITTTDTIQHLNTIPSVVAKDTSNQAIYDFMKFVIANQKLDLSCGLTIDPEPRCDLSQDDKTFLKTLLIEKPALKNETDTGYWQPQTISAVELNKCLTKGDVNYMLLQKQNLSTFKWDNTRLNFNLKNDTNWYCFSIPLFSKDKRKAVMMIRNLCKGLCGIGWTEIFTKEKNKWTSQTIGQWFY